MKNLFVYGTLQFPQIVKRLTGKIFEVTPATLPGYKRVLVKGCDYPAIVEEDRASVKGVLMKNVDDYSIQQLTVFEGDEYEKRNVAVESGSEISEAVTYVWCAGAQFLEDKDWDSVYFEKNVLKKYC